MTKVIENIELLKKLAPVLEDIETEYSLSINKDWSKIISVIDYYQWDYNKLLHPYKTLTLEEAIEFLPEEVKLKNQSPLELTIKKYWKDRWKIYYFQNKFKYTYSDKDYCTIESFDNWQPLLPAIEQTIKHLIDNKLWLND